jgi:RNA polymerase primary sigma factor
MKAELPQFDLERNTIEGPVMRNEPITLMDRQAAALGEARFSWHTNEASPRTRCQTNHRAASPEAPARRRRRDVASDRRLFARVRCQRIRELPLDYVPNAEFQRVTRPQERTLLGPAPAPAKPLPRVQPPAGLPPYLTSLYALPLLTREQELHLFRKMNYLKYKASKFIARLDPERPDNRLLDRIEDLHRQSVDVKNELILANLRLVVAFAKRHARRTEPLFELISDGNIALIRAVEKFDYARGFRFSTYASWAIIRTFLQTIPTEDRYRSRFRTGTEEVFQTTCDERIDPQSAEAAQAQRQEQVARLLTHLDDREQQIIRDRYGLGLGREPKRLREVGRAMGVTKERVRQLQVRALAKLSQAAVEEGLSDTDIVNRNIPTGIPLAYEFDEHVKPIRHSLGIPRPKKAKAYGT